MALLLVVSVSTGCSAVDRRPQAKAPAGPPGYVTSPHADFTVDLAGAGGMVTVRGKGEKVAVPAGKYRLAGWRVTADHEGATWVVSGKGYARRPLVEIVEGQDTVLEFGPPLTAGVFAKKRGGTYEFSLKMAAAGGVRLSAGDVKREGKRLPEPKFEVRDDKGKVVAQASFQYG